MSKGKHSEAQIIAALKVVEAGRKAEDVAREQGINAGAIIDHKAPLTRRFVVYYCSGVYISGSKSRSARSALRAWPKISQLPYLTGFNETRPAAATYVGDKAWMKLQPVRIQIELVHHVIVVAAIEQEDHVDFMDQVNQLAGAVFVVAVFNRERYGNGAFAVRATHAGFGPVDAAVLRQILGVMGLNEFLKLPVHRGACGNIRQHQRKTQSPPVCIEDQFEQPIPVPHHLERRAASVLGTSAEAPKQPALSVSFENARDQF
jgi:hypothetical protein